MENTRRLAKVIPLTSAKPPEKNFFRKSVMEEKIIQIHEHTRILAKAKDLAQRGFVVEAFSDASKAYGFFSKNGYLKSEKGALALLVSLKPDVKRILDESVMKCFTGRDVFEDLEGYIEASGLITDVKEAFAKNRLPAYFKEMIPNLQLRAGHAPEIEIFQLSKRTD